MSAPLLQLTSASKSFGAVRALHRVWFDLRADAPGQPGGLPEISRGLSAATPPVTDGRIRTPEGCQNRSTISPCLHRRGSLAPLRGAIISCALSGGIASRCSAQPPANFYEPSGFVL